MADLTPALIDGEDVASGDPSEVRSPYDGALVGSVPTCSTDDIDRAVAVALARHRAGALHQYERAEILDRAAVLLAERTEEFAQSISTESAKPISTARIEAARGIDTLRFSAAAARTLVGLTQLQTRRTPGRQPGTCQNCQSVTSSTTAPRRNTSSSYS